MTQHKIVAPNLGTNSLTVEVGSLPSRQVAVAMIVEKLSTGFLPPMVRWVDPSKRFWLIELKPCYMQIASQRDNLGLIPVPWQVYLVDLEAPAQFQIWFRPAALQSFDDTVYHSYMGNVYGHAKSYAPADSPCYLIISDFAGKQGLDKALSAIQKFWMSGFGWGHYIQREIGLPKEFTDADLDYSRRLRFEDTMWPGYRFLERLSLEDVLNFTYIPAGTLQDFINTALRQVTYGSLLTTAGLK